MWNLHLGPSSTVITFPFVLQGKQFMQKDADPALGTNYLSSSSCLTVDFFYLPE